MPTQITPYTDPSLSSIAEHCAIALNAANPGTVRRWIASEIPSPLVGDYPLLQAQCLEAAGPDLSQCKGSISYLIPNHMVEAQAEGVVGFLWISKTIAKALAEYEFQAAYGDCCDKPRIKMASLKRPPIKQGTFAMVDGGRVQVIWVEVLFEYQDPAIV